MQLNMCSVDLAAQPPSHNPQHLLAPSAPILPLPHTQVGNLAEGVLEGGREMARGLLAGAFGIVAKPVQGAERGGVAGFLGGVAKVGPYAHARVL